MEDGVIQVTGEIKRCDTLDSRMNEELLERWKTCQCCGDVFSVMAAGVGASWNSGEQDIQDVLYSQDKEAKELGMPIRSRKARYCCYYCQQLASRKKLKKEELLQKEFIPENVAHILVMTLQLNLKKHIETDFSDYKRIDFEKTYCHKFRYGLWRTCSNIDCPNRSIIYFTERRQWHMRYVTDTRAKPQGRIKKVRYMNLDGDRIIHLLDLDYEPIHVNLQWKYCSTRCRVACKRKRDK